MIQRHSRGKSPKSLIFCNIASEASNVDFRFLRLNCKIEKMRLFCKFSFTVQSLSFSHANCSAPNLTPWFSSLLQEFSATFVVFDTSCVRVQFNPQKCWCNPITLLRASNCGGKIAIVNLPTPMRRSSEGIATVGVNSWWVLQFHEAMSTNSLQVKWRPCANLETGLTSVFRPLPKVLRSLPKWLLRGHCRWCRIIFIISPSAFWRPRSWPPSFITTLGEDMR